MDPTLTVEIKGLLLHAHHGVMEQERTVGNRFRVDVRLRCPAAIAAAGSDDIVLTVNYAEVIDLVRREMNIPSALLEHVALRIARAIDSRFGSRVSGGSVTVAKPTPPCGVSVEGVSATVEW